MQKLMIGAATVAMALAGPALAGEGKGHGNDRGNGGGKGRAEISAKADGKGGGRHAASSVGAQARADVRVDRKDRNESAKRVERRDRDAYTRSEIRRDRDDDRRDYRRDDRREYRDDDRYQGRAEPRDRDRDRERDWSWVRRDRERVLVQGCPPGLAKKQNGCMPPGLAKRVNWQSDRNWDRGWYGYRYRPALFGLNRNDDGRYFYDDGYLLRIGDGGRVSGYLPLLGGALAIGRPWPVSYSAYDVPDYYVDYYNLGAPNSYRFADNVIYRVDPESAAITSIAALLTGDEFAIGQRLPVGYDVYNVPYAYRERYYDTPDAMYRYSDGYVYRVDPKTMLVAAAIDLVV